MVYIYLCTEKKLVNYSLSNKVCQEASSDAILMFMERKGQKTGTAPRKHHQVKPMEREKGV